MYLIFSSNFCIGIIQFCNKITTINGKYIQTFYMHLGEKYFTDTLFVMHTLNYIYSSFSCGSVQRSAEYSKSIFGWVTNPHAELTPDQISLSNYGQTFPWTYIYPSNSFISICMKLSDLFFFHLFIQTHLISHTIKLPSFQYS